MNKPAEAFKLPVTNSCVVALVPGEGVAGWGGMNDRPTGGGLSHDAVNDTVKLKPLIEPTEILDAELPP